MTNIIKSMADAHLIVSMAGGRRVISMGLVRVNGTKITDFETEVECGDLIEIGKKGKFTIVENV